MRLWIQRALEARPLLGLCAAIVVGSLGGAWHAENGWGPAGLHGAIVAAVASWCALILLARGARSAQVGLLVVCATVAALRAHTEHMTVRLATAAAVQSGRVTCVRGHDGVLARLEPSTRSWALAEGVVAPGEQVVLDPIHEPPEWPRGPILGPRAAAGTPPTVEIGPGDVARVAPAPRSLCELASSAALRLRERLVARTEALEDPTTRALLIALLFGDTSFLPEELPDLFVRTGTFHVLAVSGMQVVLVLYFLIGPISAGLAAAARLLSRGAWSPAREWFALPVLLLFVPIAGGGPPIVRSALGAAFALVAPHLAFERAARVEARGQRVCVRLARRADALSGWALALILENAWHPLAPASLSVQLSYAATFGLIVGTRPCLALIRGWLGLEARGPLLAPVTRTGHARSPWLLVGVDRAAHGACCAIAASCAAVLATLPFVWTRLGEWSPTGVLATPIAGVPSALLFVAGWIEVMCPVLVPDGLLDVCGQAMVGSMRLCDLLPGTPTPLVERPGWAIAAATALTGIGLHLGRQNRCARLAALIWAVVIVPWNPTPARVELRAFDVGAGTAVIIEGPGLGTWVFDAGSRDRPDVAREALAPWLRHVDPGLIGVVLSHADRDHDGALPWLVERYQPRIFAGALPPHVVAHLPGDVPRLALDHGTLRIAQSTSAKLELARGLSGAMSDNEASFALTLDVRGARAILFGDAEERGLDAWLARCASRESTRLVLWPHHGSDTDRLDALVRATQPDEVWISASARPRALPELERRAIVTRCTARDGPRLLVLPEGRTDDMMEEP